MKIEFEIEWTVLKDILNYLLTEFGNETNIGLPERNVDKFLIIQIFHIVRMKIFQTTINTFVC